MINYKNTIVTGCFLVIGFICPAHANYYDQLNLEKNYTDKVQRTLDAVYGERQFIVRTKITMGQESWSVTYTGAAKIKAVRSKSKQSRQTVNILPGYPVIKNLGPDELEKLPYNSRISKIPASINKVTLDVIVNDQFDRQNITSVSRLISKTLALDPQRGDRILFSYLPFQNFQAQPKSMPTESGIQREWDIVLFVLVGLLGLAVIFVCVYALFQILQYRQLKRSAESDKMGSPAVARSGLSPMLAPRQSASGGTVVHSGASTHRYFGFIQSDHVENLIYIYKQNKITIEQLGYVLGYLPTELCTQVLGLLSIQEQIIITSQLLNKVLLNQQIIEKLEQNIRRLMDCLVGGHERISHIIGFLPQSSTQQILTSLSQNNPKGYKEIRANMVLFGDLKLLGAEDIKKITSHSTLEQLSIALMGADQELVRLFRSHLSVSGRELLEQFIQLKRGSLSQADIHQAQDYVLDIVKQLDASGQIKLKEKILSKL